MDPGFAVRDPWIRTGPPAYALDGVRSRRVVAFCLDAFAIAIVFALCCLFFGLLGFVTLGLGWIVLPVLFPVVALLYNGGFISGWRMATPGMRAAGLEMRLAHGSPTPFLIAAVHAVLFYLSWTLLTPLVLLVSLFARDKRCVHDMLAGVVVTRRL